MPDIGAPTRITDLDTSGFVPPLIRLVVYGNQRAGPGDTVDSNYPIAIIPYQKWRVIAWGFIVTVDGASTVPESVSMGIRSSDVGEEDLLLFGSFTQDIAHGKNWMSGDMFVHTMPEYLYSEIAPVDRPQKGGDTLYTAGSPDGMGVWNYKQGELMISKNHVAGSTAYVRGWVMVERELP